MVTKVIALAGANGHIGKAFTKEFLSQGLELRILTRAESAESGAIHELKAIGASIHIISYNDEASIVKALEGVDVLVSAVSGAAISSAQIPLIKAAKAAGVKLFFPSEYGGVYEARPGAPQFVHSKNSILEVAKDAGLPFAVVSNGAFPEYCFIPPFGYNFAERKVTVWGDGNAKVTWTTARSVADWVANVLKSTSIEQLQNRHFRIQGNVSTTNETIALWEQKHNAKLQVDYRPLKELDDRIDANENDILAFLVRELSSGGGEVGGVDNHLYPDWKPESLKAVL